MAVDMLEGRKLSGRAVEQLSRSIALFTVSLVLASCASGQAPDVSEPPASPALAGQLPLEVGVSPSLSTPTPAIAVATAPLPAATDALVVTGAPAAAPTPEAPKEYVVEAGDTLLALATKWGVSMAAIQRENGLGGSTIVRSGLPLRVPSGDDLAAAPTYWVLYTVEEGETLGQIAGRYSLDVARLLEVNDIANADLIHVGQDIVLPLDTLAEYAESLDPSPPLPASPTPSMTLSQTAALAGDLVPTATSAVAVFEAVLPANIADWPRETVRIINAIRAQHNLPPYQYNETLARAAQAHADDCVQRGWCSHTGSDGSDVKTRVRRAGYEGTGWAECWTQRQTPQDAVDFWMDEVPPNDPHRRMMLHTWVTEVGVGIAEAPWGYYFIADFGRP